jgi:hypothetical protein
MGGREKAVIVLRRPVIRLGWIRHPGTPLFRANLRKLITSAVCILVVLLMARCAAGCHRQALRDHARSASMQNAHLIQLAIERYATDAAGNYPLSLTQLLGTSYIEDMPVNPYAGVLTWWPTLEHKRKTRILNIGEFCPGDIVYVPNYENPKEVWSYSLIMCIPPAGRKVITSVPIDVSPPYSEEGMREIFLQYVNPD